MARSEKRQNDCMAPHASRERELFSLGDVRYTIGIDLGGTNIAGAVLDAKGSFIHQIEEPTKTCNPEVPVYYLNGDSVRTR